MQGLGALIQLGLPLLLLVVAYFTGSFVERRHYASIRRREQRARRLPVLAFRDVPPGWEVQEAALVTGTVVISLDHFKRFLANLRNLVGGRVVAYESLLDRARREAILRLQESAFEAGFRAVVNLRLEGFQVAGQGEGRGTAAVEVVAYGTGLRLARAPGGPEA
ncbi:MAG TPA: heavy metal-binding domain-containing protein [Myxococcota bacterium]|jgi:uncharacterized protein YbjQ (UPF0145 family)|nr:heavy metal-binding domain-containing protein [Myxococcota bacterium]